MQGQRAHHPCFLNIPMACAGGTPVPCILLLPWFAMSKGTFSIGLINTVII